MVAMPRTHAVPDDPILGVHGVADIGGGSQNSRCQHGGHGSRLLLPCVRGFPRHPPHERCPEGLGRTSSHRLGVSTLRSDMAASLPHGLVLLRSTLLAHATRKPTVIVGYDEDGIRCRAPGWLLQSGDCTDIVPRERAED